MDTLEGVCKVYVLYIVVQLLKLDTMIHHSSRSAPSRALPVTLSFTCTVALDWVAMAGSILLAIPCRSHGKKVYVAMVSLMPQYLFRDWEQHVVRLPFLG